MRVLHVLEELAPSGAERMLELAGPMWREHGIECAVLSKGQAPGDFATRLENRGYKVHHVPTSPQRTYPARLYQFLRMHPVDVLHNHSEHANLWTATVAKAVGVPGVVRTVHTTFMFTGALRAERVVQRRLLRALGILTVAVGESVRANEWDRFWNPARLIENWYDVASFAPASLANRAAARTDLGLPSDAEIIALVGNCGPVKGHPRVLRAMTDLSLADVICLHAGHEDDHRSEWQLAWELGVGDRCKFLGPLTDITTVLHAADVFAMPSHYEGFSIAALEALSTGMPAVLTRVPGLIDLAAVDAGVQWAEPGSSLAPVLRTALDEFRDESQRQAIHERVARRYGAARAVAQYAALYREAAGDGARRESVR